MRHCKTWCNLSHFGQVTELSDNGRKKRQKAKYNNIILLASVKKDLFMNTCTMNYYQN